jgi:hypothetical protein
MSPKLTIVQLTRAPGRREPKQSKRTSWKGIAQCSKVRDFRSRARAAIQFSAHLIGYGKTHTLFAQNAAVASLRVEMKLWKCTSQPNENSPSRSKSQTINKPNLVEGHKRKLALSRVSGRAATDIHKGRADRARSNVRGNALVNPVRGYDPAAAPFAAIQDELAYPCKVA